ncbi:MAG TPA: right-handed parallel beta-helix repeat-containing protein [Candidatus Anammoximicrobium sp.]|nr:right-handed parallel beta-helix repeat-containing protein [Candidatus Anammoximicrobium sp.]
MRTRRFMTAIVLMILGAGRAMPAVNLYVSPSGSDAWSGSLPAPDKDGRDGPLASLIRARDELRRLKAAGNLGDGAVVNLRGGTYRLTTALALGPEDAGTPQTPIIWRAHEDEKVTLTGSLPVSGFKPWKGQIMVADLKGTALENVAFRQLFFRGQRQVMARYPNVDPEDPHFGQWAYVLAAEPAPPTNRSVSDNIPHVKDHFTATSDVIKPSWDKITRAEIAIHPAYGWAWNIVPVKSVDKESDTIWLGRPVSYGLMIGDRYFVQNLLAELDAPGEWYLDRDEAKLYFWPPAELASGEVSVPVAESLIVVEGANAVTVRGLTMECCGGNAVTFKNCEGSLLAGCTIRNTGLWGVSIAGGRNTGAMGNDIYATGAGGVSINSGDRRTLTRGDCYADNNYIHHIAAFQRTYNTGVNLSGVGNRASHNLIHDCYHQALLVGGNDHVVEYNVVHHTNLGSEDTGGLYMSSRDFTQRGTVIRHNVFHHVGGFGKSNSWNPVRNGQVEFHYPGFTWGIYLDAPEVGCTVFGNVLYSVPVCGLFNHEGRDNCWENNIIVDAPAFRTSSGNYPDLDKLSYSYIQALREKGGYDTYLQHYPELATYTGDPATHHTCAPGKFARNIVYYTADGGRMMRDRNKSAWSGGQLVWTFSGGKPALAGFEFDYNCVYAPPELPLKFSLTLRPDAAQTLDWDGWRRQGKDEHSLLADPKFVDPAKHDYRLQPDSPALKLGFQPIPFDKIGPYQDPLRASWPIVEAPGAAALGDFTTQRFFKLPGREPVPAVELQPRQGLGNVAAKLKAGQSVSVAVFAGGNHAQGQWTATAGKWLQTQYPSAKLTIINSPIHGGFRGSGLSVFRLGHDVLRHRPDLLIVDFAADDFESSEEAVQANAEGMVRQAWKADPNMDVLFVYAFRLEYEADYAQGLCPSAVSAYERVAARYGVPAINMGHRLAQMARDGKLTLKAPDADSLAKSDQPAFTKDGISVSPTGVQLYATIIQEGLAKLLADGSPQPHTLPKPLTGRNMEGAVQKPITREMLSGDWQEIVPAAVAGSNFSNHFDRLWVTRTPGARLTFNFTGTRAWIFDVFGPGTGRVKVTVDGVDKGERQQVDPWSYYYRLGALEIASNLPPGEHAATIELLSDSPNRSVPIEAAKKANRYQPADFAGVALHLGAICVLEEP